MIEFVSLIISGYNRQSNRTTANVPPGTVTKFVT